MSTDNYSFLFHPKEAQQQFTELFQPKEGRKRKENVSNNYIELSQPSLG